MKKIIQAFLIDDENIIKWPKTPKQILNAIAFTGLNLKQKIQYNEQIRK